MKDLIQVYILKSIDLKYRHTSLKITQPILKLHIKSLQILAACQKEFCEYLADSWRYAHFSASIF